MATEVIMPKMGLTMTEGTVVRWLKQVGEPVAAGEPLLEIETDKVVLTVEAQAGGTLLATLAGQGERVPVAQVIGYIGRQGEEVPATAAVPPAPAPAAAEPPAPAPEAGERIKATPLAKGLARQHGIDLATVAGSGPGGRIVEADVQQAIAAQAQRTEAAAPAALSELRPLSAVQRVTAERMAESFRTAPHFYLQVEVRATRLVELRQALLVDLQQRFGVHLTYTDLLLRALALTLPAHPLLNASWQEGQVRTFPEVHLGVAVATPGGLTVPVIHRAESMPLEQLAQARQALAAKANEGRLTLDDVAGGTFTLTNLGMFGVDAFIPILNPPQSAILAAGAIAERAVGEDGHLALRPTLHLTLACDHRVVDGAQGAIFLRDLRELLEAPARLLLGA